MFKQGRHMSHFGFKQHSNSSIGPPHELKRPIPSRFVTRRGMNIWQPTRERVHILLMTKVERNRITNGDLKNCFTNILVHSAPISHTNSTASCSGILKSPFTLVHCRSCFVSLIRYCGFPSFCFFSITSRHASLDFEVAIFVS